MSAAAGETRRFPWDEAIALGLGLLRLSPRDFWMMTPRELAHAMRIHGGGMRGTAPTRAVLQELMDMFPETDERPAR